MKSEFLSKLSKLLIPDKETDYIDLYNLQSIPTWPLFTVLQHTSDSNEFFVVEKVEDKSKYNPEDIDFLGIEYCEIISFDEEKLILDTGGEWQGLHRVTIALADDFELYVQSCNVIPELSDNINNTLQRHSEEEYSNLLDELQLILENQN